MRKPNGHRHELPRERGINVTPLIDIVFQLLIFFMIASSLVRPSEIDLDLPDAESGEKAAKEPALVVSYKPADGGTRIALNEQAVPSLKALGERMKRASSSKDTRVQLRIASSVPYERVMDLVDTVRRAGHPRFALLTVSEGGQDG